MQAHNEGDDDEIYNAYKCVALALIQNPQYEYLLNSTLPTFGVLVMTPSYENVLQPTTHPSPCTRKACSKSECSDNKPSHLSGYHSNESTPIQGIHQASTARASAGQIM